MSNERLSRRDTIKLGIRVAGGVAAAGTIGDFLRITATSIRIHSEIFSKYPDVTHNSVDEAVGILASSTYDTLRENPDATTAPITPDMLHAKTLLDRANARDAEVNEEEKGLFSTERLAIEFPLAIGGTLVALFGPTVSHTGQNRENTSAPEPVNS
jgi:hypothetical protein